MAAAVYLQAATALLPLPRALDPTLIRLAGWDGLARDVAASGGDFVAADSYGLAAMLAYQLPGPVLGAEARWALFDLPLVPMAGRTGLLVRSRRRGGLPDAGPWADMTPMGSVTRRRGGVIAEEYELYRVTARAPETVLPSR